MEPQLYTHTLSHTHNTKDPHFLPKRTSAKHIKNKKRTYITAQKHITAAFANLKG